MSMNANVNYFYTSDFPLCSVLIGCGFQPDSLDRSDERRTTFIFQKTKELEKAIQAYWNRELKVEPLALFDSQRYLKSRIYGSE